MVALNDWYGVHSALLNLMGINILLALSVYVPLSCAVLSLSNAAFMGIGAYTAALLTIDANWPFWAVLPAGGLAAALVALPLGLPVVRLRGVYVAIMTLGFGEVIGLAALGLPVAGGAGGLQAIPGDTVWWQIGLALLVVVYFLRHVERSRLGHAFAAIRQDEVLAASLGINIRAHKLIAFLLGACIAGLAGGLYVHLTHQIAPADFGLDRAVDMLFAAVLGGSGTFWGSVPSAALLTLLPEWLRGLAAVLAAPQLGAFDLHQIVTGVLILLVVVYFPGGISGTLGRRRGQRPGRNGQPGDDEPAAGAVLRPTP